MFKLMGGFLEPNFVLWLTTQKLGNGYFTNRGSSPGSRIIILKVLKIYVKNGRTKDRR